MPSGEQQLQSDFALVQKLLHDYPRIKIVATKGEPPEQYDLEYTIKGYKENPDGTILPSNRHQVRISLPFGYPHFPPAAKPLTSIFHPDIDPDAIRIADFWKEGKTLPELIIHIGKMICGTFYSNDPFNQRAFDWFEERKSWMPFDILEPHDDDEDYGPILGRGAAAGDTSAPAGKPASEPAEEEIPLDFAAEDEGAPRASESMELDDLLGGELSFAFDLEEPPEEPGGDTGAIDDLTHLKAESQAPAFDLELETEQLGTEIEFDDLTKDLGELGPFEFELETPAADEPATDLSGLQDETPALDFNLESEPGFTAETQFEDLAAGGESAFAAGFNLEEEPLTTEAGTIELGDLAGLATEDFGSLGSLTELSEDVTELATSAAPEQPLEEEFAIDFGIAETPAAAEETKVAPVMPAEDGMLGGISLQLDADQGRKHGDHARAIRPLIEKKEIFNAKKVLADIPDPDSVPDYQELELTISAAINEAEELYKKADKHEQKGDLEKAGLLLDLAANIAVDYPGLEFARNRIRESLLASGTMKAGDTDTGKTEAAEAGTATGGKKAAAKLRLKLPFKLLGTVAGIIAVAGGAFFLYLKDNAHLEKARTEVTRGKQLVEKMNFMEASKAFTTARTELGGVLILRGGKNELIATITAIVDTKPFKEGLQGRVLLNGEYVPLETAQAIEGFGKQIDTAEKAKQAGKLDQALSAYEKSLEYAEKAGLKDKVPAIRENIDSLNLQQTVSQARKAEEEHDWKKAAEIYQQALGLSGTLFKPEEQGQIVKHLASASLRQKLEESREAFTASDWQKTVEVLQRAQKIITDNPTIVSETEKVQIDRLLINAGVYQVLADARKAFEQQDWDGAIKGYDRAVVLLRENEKLLGPEEVNDSVGKIEKTVLMTKISREQNQIDPAATDSSTMTKNLELYRAIASLVEKSPLRNKDAVLEEILTNAINQSAALEKEILINSKVEYLQKNYETIFRENYPSAKSSELLNPQVKFIKREADILIFTMSCAERSQGRTFRLELNYQFDMDKSAWSLYSGKL